ncbi:helix-turn-helix transcriptional regulator [Paraglaciecola hydrolytica]|uniref:Helix-turn-helix domain-containing protein n=1 Tax=Paraglaciecola hydrolytica TaxID=1799789 RepID=A0A148KKJ0_9ALTE|nr:hypothetical protein [Paraglaciecola hydrolytica]KXI26781.1 hypothetical protein AX660_03155 [Paraglaciecola hydrolytica]
MKTLQLLDRYDLAALLKTTPETISNQIYLGKEGDTVPVSIKLGSKRLWRATTVEDWLQQKEQINCAQIKVAHNALDLHKLSKKSYRPQNPKGIRLIQKQPASARKSKGSENTAMNTANELEQTQSQIDNG